MIEQSFFGGPMDGDRVAWSEPKQWVVYVSGIRPVLMAHLRHTYAFMGGNYWYVGVGIRVPEYDYHEIIWLDAVAK